MSPNMMYRFALLGIFFASFVAVTAGCGSASGNGTPYAIEINSPGGNVRCFAIYSGEGVVVGGSCVHDQ